MSKIRTRERARLRKRGYGGGNQFTQDWTHCHGPFCNGLATCVCRATGCMCRLATVVQAQKGAGR